MIGGHGHVVPRADGVKASCGGPALCEVCAKEQAMRHAEHRCGGEVFCSVCANEFRLSTAAPVALAPDGQKAVPSAVRWQGDLSVFKPWIEHYKSVPILLSPLPMITLNPGTTGACVVAIGDWIHVDEQGKFSAPNFDEVAYARGYLGALLRSLDLEIIPLPDLVGMCTQIDNAITALKSRALRPRRRTSDDHLSDTQVRSNAAAEALTEACSAALVEAGNANPGPEQVRDRADERVCAAMRYTPSNWSARALGVPDAS